MKKKIINYPVNYYSCNAVINGRWFVELGISQYYKSKRGRSTVSDEVIRELVRQLHGRRLKRDENGYFSFDLLYIDYRAYKLV
jgi:transposase